MTCITPPRGRSSESRSGPVWWPWPLPWWDLSEPGYLLLPVTVPPLHPPGPACLPGCGDTAARAMKGACPRRRRQSRRKPPVTRASMPFFTDLQVHNTPEGKNRTIKIQRLQANLSRLTNYLLQDQFQHPERDEAMIRWLVWTIRESDRRRLREVLPRGAGHPLCLFYRDQISKAAEALQPSSVSGTRSKMLNWESGLHF